MLIAHDSPLNIILLALAVFRLYLEIIGLDFTKLPIGKAMAKVYGPERVQRFHRTGLILTIGYIVFMAPPLIFS